MNNTRDAKVLKKFGQHLKSLREKKKLSLRKLADIADVDFSQIHRIENGESNPTFTMLTALANALEISVSELVTLK
jgi:transcriptional regulator with XRE-family HTH domain